MIFKFLIAILFTFHSALGQADLSTKDRLKQKVIIAYYAGSRSLPVNDIKANKITHINYAFANIHEGKVVEGNAQNDNAKFKELVELRNQHPHLKLLISVGGWSWSDHFSDAALTEGSRKVFASSAVSFLVRHRLDGIDLDWEYPGQPGEGNIFRSEDKQNFTLLLKAVREELDSLSRLTQQHYLLTIATAANQSYLDHTEMSIAHQYLDYVNIMSYDYFGGWSQHTGHHTALGQWGSDKAINYTTRAVKQHLTAGVPASKIVMGVAFYGRGWPNVAHNGTTPLYQKYDGQAFALSYDSITRLRGYVRYWDSTALAPYLWNASHQTLITYDDSKSLRHKCEFVWDQELAGVMFWEYTQDPSGVLVETLFNNLQQP